MLSGIKNSLADMANKPLTTLTTVLAFSAVAKNALAAPTGPTGHANGKPIWGSKPQPLNARTIVNKFNLKDERPFRPPGALANLKTMPQPGQEGAMSLILHDKVASLESRVDTINLHTDITVEHVPINENLTTYSLGSGHLLHDKLDDHQVEVAGYGDRALRFSDLNYDRTTAEGQNFHTSWNAIGEMKPHAKNMWVTGGSDTELCDKVISDVAERHPLGLGGIRTLIVDPPSLLSGKAATAGGGKRSTFGRKIDPKRPDMANTIYVKYIDKSAIASFEQYEFSHHERVPDCDNCIEIVAHPQSKYEFKASHDVSLERQSRLKQKIDAYLPTGKHDAATLSGAVKAAAEDVPDMRSVLAVRLQSNFDVSRQNFLECVDKNWEGTHILATMERNQVDVKLLRVGARQSTPTAEPPIATVLTAPQPVALSV